MRLIARNIFFSLVGFAWSFILALAIMPIIVRGLGEAAYGISALVGNVIGYMVIFNSLQTAGTKYLAEYVAVNDRDSIRKLKGTSLFFNLAIGIVGGGIILILAKPLATDIFKIPVELQPQSVMAFRLAGLGFFLGAVGWWGAAILAGVQRFDLLMGIAIAANTVSAFGSVLAIWLGWGVVGVIVADVIGAALSAILYAWRVQLLFPQAGWSFAFDGIMSRRIFSYGLFSTLQVIFGVLMSQLDRTLLGVWIGVAAVTIYSVPLSVANSIHQVCAKALEVVFPVSSGLEAQSRTAGIKRLFLRAQNLNVVLVAMFTVPLIALGPEILRFWISPGFAVQGSTVFRLLVIAYALFALNVVAAAMVAGFGHPEINALFVVLMGLGNLLGYILFIPRWGVNGAGLASVMGSLISVPLFLWYVNKRFVHLPVTQILLGVVMRPTIAAIVVAGCLVLLRPLILNLLVLFFALAGSCSLYLALTFLLRVWKAEELDLLRQLWERMAVGWLRKAPSGE